MRVIVVGNKVVNLGARYICGGVVLDQLVLFNCVGQALADIGVIMQNGVALVALLLQRRVEILDVHNG